MREIGATATLLRVLKRCSASQVAPTTRPMVTKHSLVTQPVLRTQLLVIKRFSPTQPDIAMRPLAGTRSIATRTEAQTRLTGSAHSTAIQQVGTTPRQGFKHFIIQLAF